MRDHDLRTGAVLAGTHQCGDGPIRLLFSAGFVSHMDGSLRRGIGDDMDAKGMQEGAYQRTHPAIFDEVVEVLQSEAGTQGGLIHPQLSAQVFKIHVGVCLNQGLCPAHQQHHGAGGGLGVNHADLLVRILFQRQLPAHHRGVIGAGEIGGNGKADCPYCSGRKALPGKTSFAALHPDLMEDWDFIANYCLVNPDEILDTYSQKVWWNCKRSSEHKYPLSPADKVFYQKRHRESCPYCKGRRRKKKFF